jgi:hypothetical protein
MQTGTLTENSVQTQTTAFGSGNLTINISPFDNYYKFQFLKAGTEGNPVAIDLSSSGNYNMVFVDEQGKKTYVPALLDNTIARPSGGELAFKVDESVSSKVLAFTDRRFFIVNGGNLTPGATGSNLSGVAQGATTISGNDQRSADMLSTFIKTTDTAAASITSTASLPASVMYWGYWKKEGEVEIVAPVAATGPVTPIGTTGATSAPEPIEIIAPKPIIKGVKPIVIGPTGLATDIPGIVLSGSLHGSGRQQTTDQYGKHGFIHIFASAISRYGRLSAHFPCVKPSGGLSAIQGIPSERSLK